MLFTVYFTAFFSPMHMRKRIQHPRPLQLSVAKEKTILSQRFVLLVTIVSRKKATKHRVRFGGHVSPRGVASAATTSAECCWRLICSIATQGPSLDQGLFLAGRALLVACAFMREERSTRSPATSVCSRLPSVAPRPDNDAHRRLQLRSSARCNSPSQTLQQRL